MVRTLDDSKRIAIVDAAKNVFLRDGFASAKIADIAAEAGVASGTLYLYFKSKDVLLGAIFEDFLSRLSCGFGSVIKGLHTPSGVVTLVDWSLNVAEGEKNVLALIAAGAHNSLSHGRSSFVQNLQIVLDDLIERGAIRPYKDSTVLARLIASVMRELVLSYSIYDTETMRAMRETAIAFLQYALFDDVTMVAERLVNAKKSK